jgi:hypothetical protein
MTANVRRIGSGYTLLIVSPRESWTLNATSRAFAPSAYTADVRNKTERMVLVDMSALEHKWKEESIAAMQRAIGRTLRECHPVDDLLDERMRYLVRRVEETGEGPGHGLT